MWKKGAPQVSQLKLARCHTARGFYIPARRKVFKKVHPTRRSFSGNASQVRESLDVNKIRRPLGRKPLFDKILIANRGEIACRVIRTARRLGIQTVAVFSEVDRDALHVQQADEAYCIGAAPASESYLRIDKIIEVALASGAKAVHPGYGFLSENAHFAEKLHSSGLVFIGPPSSAIKSMGSKSESKDIMTAAGVPCVPGYHGTDQRPEHLLSQAAAIGYPVLIKAVMGGGGKGMRVVESEERFPESLESAIRESRKSFGDERVLIEKYITEPRHIEVQVFADSLGNTIGLWERDCSVQRRHQKIIEEAPAPGISSEVRRQLTEQAVAAAAAVGYVGAGTVEFIYNNADGKFYFMEMNTRLQVEHPVTEMITGQDLVEWQLEVAAGNAIPLAQSEVPLLGHAFEVRIYAENPRNGFLPDSGLLLHIKPPTLGDSVRLDEGYLPGSNVGVFYDPLISKLVVHGKDRQDALRILRKALGELEIVGVSTNIEFLRSLAGHHAFVAGEVETGFIEKYRSELLPSHVGSSAGALSAAALYSLLRDQAPATSTSPWSTLSFNRFGVLPYERVVSLDTDTRPRTTERVLIKVESDKQYEIELQTTPRSDKLIVEAELQDPSTLCTLESAHLSRSTVVPEILPYSTQGMTDSANRLHIFRDGEQTSWRIPNPKWLLKIREEVHSNTGAGLKAPMPSLVVDIKVKPGDKVAAGQALVVLESMKTEIVLRAENNGIVQGVMCKAGEMVAEGKELVSIVPT